MARSARVLIGQPHRGFHAREGQRIIFDLFTPILLELEQIRRTPRLLLKQVAERLRSRRALRDGDRLIVASAVQREYYEAMARAGGIEVDADWLEVPFGIDRSDPPQMRPSNPPVILWNGGIWNWMDAESAVSAVKRLNADGVECRLVFSGTHRPLHEGNLQGVRNGGGVIEWTEGWTPYAERGEQLARARAIVMLHRRTPEARTAYRIRFADALWARIPLVASRGGAAASIIEREGLGLVVEPEDRDGVVRALKRIVEDDALHASCVSSIERVREEFFWDTVVTPLRDAVETLLRD